MTESIDKISFNRECDGCTACCQGWLAGSAYQQEFYPGTPCHFLSCTGCKIYENRPESPCKSYACEWLINGDIPEWFKPSESNIIITRREYTKDDDTKEKYLDVTEMGTTIHAKYLNWLFSYHLRTQTNLRIEVERGKTWYGSEEFYIATNPQFEPPIDNKLVKEIQE